MPPEADTLYLITGDDEERIREAARERVRQLVGEDADPFSLDVFKDSDQQPTAELLGEALAALRTPSLLGGRKTVWLRDLTALADDRGAAGAKRGDLLSRVLGELAAFIQNEFPEDLLLVINGPGLPTRSPLYTACKQLGTVLALSRPDLRQRNWRGQVAQLVTAAGRARGMTLARATIDYLVEVIGTETGRIEPELEKLYCYAGATADLAAAQAVCSGSREAVFYALTNALGARDLGQAFTAMNQLLGHAKNPESAVIGLVRQAAGFFRDLLNAKLLLSYLKLRSGGELERRVQQLSDTERQRFAGNSVLSMAPFRVRMLGDQAGNYTGRELLGAIRALAVADRRLVSTGLPRRTILETLAVQIIGKTRR